MQSILFLNRFFFGVFSTYFCWNIAGPKKLGYKIEVIEKNTDVMYDKTGSFDGNTVLS